MSTKAKFFGPSAIMLYLLCIISNNTGAQELPTQLIQVTGGYSKHGSGDMKGIVFGTEYSKYKTTKFSWNYYFRGGINNSKHTIILNHPGGGQTDHSIRFTTAGVQLGMNGRLSILRNQQHEFLVSLGAFGRYQSASNGSDGYSLYYPTTTGMPTILVEYSNRSPQKTYAAGGLLQLQYSFTTRKNCVIGIAPGFQADTNGDAIPQAVLTLGKRF